MELSKKIYGKQFATVTTHKKVQSYFNEKCAKYLMFDLKRFTGVIFHGDAKFEEKLTCCLENDMRNFENFHQSTQKCQNWNFDKIFLLKVENV